MLCEGSRSHNPKPQDSLVKSLEFRAQRLGRAMRISGLLVCPKPQTLKGLRFWVYGLGLQSLSPKPLRFWIRRHVLS